MKKAAIILCALSAAALGQTVTAPVAVAPAYSYFAETGISLDYFAQTMASTSGFGVRIGTSNAFSVTNIDTPIAQPGVNYATLRTAIEYHVAASKLWEFMGLGSVGVTTNGSTGVANFAGGAGVSFDIGSWLSKGKFSLPVVGQLRIVAITATQVKPTYGFLFRKTF